MTAAALPRNALRHDAQVIGLVGLAHSVSHFFHLILAPLFPWIKVEFGLSYSQLGLLMTAFFVVSAIVQTASGFIVDRFGARPVLFGGMACLGASALVLAASPTYSMLMLGAAVAGMGNGVFHPVDFTLLNKHVSQPRLGHAFSVHGISGNLGWAAAPVFLVTIANLSTWRTALVGASILAFTVLATLVLYRGALDPKEIRDTVGKPAAATTSDGASNSMLAFLKLPQVWGCWTFFLITTFALSGIQNFSSTALTQIYDISLSLATASYTVFMLSSAVGMVLGGFAAGRIANHDRLIAWSFMLSGSVAVVVGIGWFPGWMVPILLGMIGFGSGVAGPSRDLLVRAAAPKGATGRVYGVVYSGLDIGLASGPLLFGAIMDIGQPMWLFILVGLLQVCAIFTAVTVGNGNRSRRQVAAQQTAA